MRNPGMVMAIAAVLAAAAGCSPQQQQGVREDVKGVRQELGQAAEQARKAAADAGLEGKVKSALMSRKGLDGRSINVEAKDGAVTLKGDVTSPEQAELAEKVAMETEGVSSVRNVLTMRVPAKQTLPSAGGSGGGY